MPKYTVDGSFFVQQLSGIFFNMNTLNSDFFAGIKFNITVYANRLVKL